MGFIRGNHWVSPSLRMDVKTPSICSKSIGAKIESSISGEKTRPHSAFGRTALY